MIWIVIVSLILSAAVLVGYYYGRRGGVRPDEEAVALTERTRSWAGMATDRTRDWAGTATDKTRDWAGSAREWLRLGRPKSTDRFVTWVADLSGMGEAFKTWVEGLAPHQVEEFAQGAASFASGLGVELAWLLDGKMDEDADLKQEIEDAMVLYCQGYWKAALVQEDTETFAAFLAWQDDPKKHRDLSQRLFARLVEDGTIATSPDLYLASEKERWDHIVQSLRDFAGRDRSAFLALFKQVRATPTTAEPAPEPVEEAPKKKSRSRSRSKTTDTAEATA